MCYSVKRKSKREALTTNSGWCLFSNNVNGQVKEYYYNIRIKSVEEMKVEDNEYCECEVITGSANGFEDSFGYWDMCTKCGKKLEDGQHYYNHYDGEDHDDVDMF